MHIPVLQKEVLEYLKPGPNENFIDCTINGGGHGLAILEKILPGGKLLGIDRDSEIISNLGLKIQNTKVKDNLILVCDNFANLKEIAKKQQFNEISGILFDLGLSSWHLEESKRGFSFQKNEPLDMRYDRNSEKTCEEVINKYPQKEIERILREYGEEQFARQISEKIIAARKLRTIRTTFELKDLIRRAVPDWYQHRRIHFTTRTFQALRIAVNDELDNLEKALPQAIDILKPKGRMVIISFHSLEDGIAKNFFKKNFQKGRLKILTEKPLTAGVKETLINRRARSAKLRAAIKS